MYNIYKLMWIQNYNRRQGLIHKNAIEGTTQIPIWSVLQSVVLAYQSSKQPLSIYIGLR